MGPIAKFFNTLLSFTHPPLYKGTTLSREKMCNISAISPLTTKWNSVFHGISVICNRITPPHTDRNGNWAWFDQLISFGSYDGAKLELRDLGLSLDYPSGTIVQLSGNLLTHEVGPWEYGDRICYVHWVKKTIFDRLNIPLPDWSYLDDVQKLLK